MALVAAFHNSETMKEELLYLVDFKAEDPSKEQLLGITRLWVPCFIELTF
jgi:hypothetical protein